MRKVSDDNVSVFDGDELCVSIPFIRPSTDFEGLYLFGEDMNGIKTCVALDFEMLSRHMMLIGGIGTGKTNALNQLVRQIEENEHDDDIVIIFDTKGDFRKNFFTKGTDVILSNADDACGCDGQMDYWNLFGEVDRGEHMHESILEICKTIFAERLDKTSQIFFPSAAKDLLAAVITYIIREYPEEDQNNETLFREIAGLDAGRMFDILQTIPEMRSMCAYIDDRAGEQALGIMAELQSVFRETFLGNFTKKGTLAMSQLVRNKGGRCVFIEYDLKTGNALKPIYELLFDLALKEALGRSKAEGNVWMIVDELSLLPKLMHLEDAVNFGRSLGVKMIVGIQNIEQIIDAYGDNRARSMISGFMTKIIFNLSDPESRKYVVELYGRNRKKESYMHTLLQQGRQESIRDANVVEDWDVSRLQPGDAIISLPYSSPFLFHFGYYKYSN